MGTGKTMATAAAPLLLLIVSLLISCPHLVHATCRNIPSCFSCVEDKKCGWCPEDERSYCLEASPPGKPSKCKLPIITDSCTLAKVDPTADDEESDTAGEILKPVPIRVVSALHQDSAVHTIRKPYGGIVY